MVAQNTLKKNIKNIFSFGDSILERKALFTAAKSVDRTMLSKSIKFIEAADIKALRNQISIISHNIENMVVYPNDIDLVMRSGGS